MPSLYEKMLKKSIQESEQKVQGNVSQENGNLGKQEATSPLSHHPIFPGTQENSKIFSQEPRKMGTWENRKRSTFPQQTFNIHPDVIDMLDDTKRDLRRRYDIKTSKEVLVEEVIRYACQDFQEKKEESFLMRLLKEIPGTQENGNLGK